MPILVVLVLLLQHAVLVLVFKQRLCQSPDTCLAIIWFFLFFQRQLLSQLLLQQDVAVYVCMLSSGFGYHLCSPPPIMLCTWIFAVLVYWGLILYIAPFLWGKVSDSSAWHYDDLLIIFQLCNVVWLWMLLTGSWDELCGRLPSLFQATAYHQSAVCPSAFPAIFLLKVCLEISSFLFPLSLVCWQHPTPSSVC
jgi:hypothetical protein